MAPLSRDSLLLVLQLLESPARTYSRSAIVDFHGRKGEDLIASGVLVPSGVARLPDADDSNGDARLVTFDRERDSFGFFDPSRGWVPFEQTSARLYRADVLVLLTLLLDGSLRFLPHGVHEIVPGMVWEVGDIRLLKKQRSSVWFVRRLDDHDTTTALADAVSNRPSASVRLILTSTRSDFHNAVSFPMTRIVSIQDVLSGDDPGTIDTELLGLRLAGVPAPISELVHLSEDGRTLTLHGKMTIHFHGAIHKQIIKLLVAAHRAGEAVVASELLSAAGSSARLFSQGVRAEVAAAFTVHA